MTYFTGTNTGLAYAQYTADLSAWENEVRADALGLMSTDGVGHGELGWWVDDIHDHPGRRTGRLRHAAAACEDNPFVNVATRGPAEQLCGWHGAQLQENDLRGQRPVQLPVDCEDGIPIPGATDNELRAAQTSGTHNYNCEVTRRDLLGQGA